MTDPDAQAALPETAPPAAAATAATAADDWETLQSALEERYPGQRPSVLFCLWKLQQDEKAGLADFRDEAKMRGIPIAGRALHSAKVLLGLAEPATRKSSKPKAAATETATRAPARRERGDASIEDTLLTAVRRMQNDAGEEAARLRAAIREAIDLLERALER